MKWISYNIFQHFPLFRIHRVGGTGVSFALIFVHAIKPWRPCAHFHFFKYPPKIHGSGRTVSTGESQLQHISWSLFLKRLRYALNEPWHESVCGAGRSPAFPPSIDLLAERSPGPKQHSSRQFYILKLFSARQISALRTVFSG